MSEYSDNQKARAKKHLSMRIDELPAYCRDYFRMVEQNNTPATWTAYSDDIYMFYRYLSSEYFQGKTIPEISLDDLAGIKAADIEAFGEYIQYGKYKETPDEKLTIYNGENAIARKYSTLKNFFGYFYGHEMLPANPASVVKLPRATKKKVKYLEKDEVKDLLYALDTGEGLTDKQREYFNKTRLRDITIISLLLDTGLRVSECVGLDVTSVDLKKCMLLDVHRKENKDEDVPFSDKLKGRLEEYLDWRKTTFMSNIDEKALFISLQGCRMSVRSVERLVKKFTTIIGRNDLSTHKLRSTMAMNKYEETSDAVLTAAALSHSGLGAVQKYIEASDRKIIEARNITTL